MRWRRGADGTAVRRVLRAIAPIIALALIFAVGWIRRAEWKPQLVDKGIGGDGLHYYGIAHFLERSNTVSIADGAPTYTRLPGYPMFLRMFASPSPELAHYSTIPEKAELNNRWIARASSANLAIDLLTSGAAFLVALALGAGPFALLPAFAWAMQPWSSVLAMHPLSDGLATFFTALCLAPLLWGVRTGRARWFAVAGSLAALAQYVRPDAVLLVPALALGGALTDGDRSARLKCAGAGLLAYALVFAPWPVRNLIQFGHAHALGAQGVDRMGRPFDRLAVDAWLFTWATNEHDTVDVAWKFPEEPASISRMPPEAIGSPAERQRLLHIAERAKDTLPDLDAATKADLFALARERCARAPWRCFVVMPLLRMKILLWGPRDGFGMGTLPSLRVFRNGWCAADHVAVALGLIGLLAMYFSRERRAQSLLLCFALGSRLLAIGFLHPSVEPRYFLEGLPPILAAGSLVPAMLYPWLARRRTQQDETKDRPRQILIS